MQMRGLTAGTCLRVVDGDTILARIICPCCHVESQQRIRLARINAPELKGPTAGAGRQAKAYLGKLCRPGPIMVMIAKAWPDRYGRVLAEVYADRLNMSDMMLEAHLALPWGMPPLADWFDDSKSV